MGRPVRTSRANTPADMSAPNTVIWSTCLFLLLAAAAAAQDDGGAGHEDGGDLAGAVGTSDDDMLLADLLLAKGLITQEEWEGIRVKIARRRREADERALQRTLERTLERLATQPPPEGWSDGQFDVSMGSSGLKVVSPDKDMSFEFGGRMQLDGAVFDEGESPMGNGTEARRIRMRMNGTAYDDWGYKLEVDFSSTGSSDVTDAWVKYGPWETADVLVGHQKVPFSQQSMTSSNWQVFQERALPDAFIDTRVTGRRRLGLTANSWGDHYYASSGLFGEGLNDDGRNNEDWGVAGRFVAAPVAEDDELLSFGGAVYYRDLSPNSLLRFSSRPESQIAGTRLVDTGIIAGAEDLTMANAEMTVVFGPFHAEAEVFDVQVGRNSMDTVGFDGMYAQAGWFLTGETRPYSMKGARFGRVMPADEGGAWEVAARYSQIDVSNRDVRGGRQENVTLGLNWWINPSMVWRFAYVYIHALETAESLNLNSASQHASAVQMRFQVVF